VTTGRNKTTTTTTTTKAGILLLILLELIIIIIIIIIVIGIEPNFNRPLIIKYVIFVANTFQTLCVDAVVECKFYLSNL
jgi:hypothetical protein